MGIGNSEFGIGKKEKALALALGLLLTELVGSRKWAVIGGDLDKIGIK